MYAVRYETIRVDLNNTKDLKRYDAVLNDPTCSIIKEIREKISHKEFDGEGKLASLNEELVSVVTYQRKSLLEE